MSSFNDCGDFLQCMGCVLSGHALAPLHRLQEWTGQFWTTVTLESLGLVYQLAPTARTMVVMDTEYIHTVRYRYCACDMSDRASNLDQLLRSGWYLATTVDPATCATFASLELFRLLNVVRNINVHDFDQYKAFGHMACQYAFLKRLKRAGRGHDPAGINLPDGWRNVSPEFRFLYMLLLAMDTNFPRGPASGRGVGHLVEEGPYKEHLKGYVAEKDVSTCIAFAALMQKDTRLTTGLRCSGVGGVVCARHKLVRPQGVGDLQKGEQYANMDYILLSAVLGITAMYLAISYDIACQWQIHLPERMEAMPEHMRLDLAMITILFALPVWHAAAHERSCQVQNSLSYLMGVGRTDGEGNAAWRRHDAMEDKIDHHNFEKNINEGECMAAISTMLPRKLILAIDERDWQVAAFKEVDRTLKKEVRKEWQKQIDEWNRDKSKPNPYESGEGAEGEWAGEAAIRLSLAQDEAQEAVMGGGKLHGSSVISFLTVGLQLEESQRRIRDEIKGCALLAADQSERIAEMRISFFTKLRKFRKLQAVYMPSAVQELEEEEDARDSEMAPPKAEDVKLYLLSGLRTVDRDQGCRRGLPAMEGKLHDGQCQDALKLLRTCLHAKRHLLNHRETNVAGQRAATRSYMLVGRIGERVDAVATKYRRARLALIALWGLDACAEVRELKPADVQLDEEREIDAKARKKLGSIGSKFRRQGPSLSSKEKCILTPIVAVCVEWSKAKARKERWEEEVDLLREEMKRAASARQIARHFKTVWDTSAATTIRTAVRDDVVLAESMGLFAQASQEGVAGDIDGSAERGIGTEDAMVAGV
ncbi:hypothetical protein B0H13DRAFT_2245702 [Mycena leptocephala]|nr:hypothetical protein B0H13DRAFT_2245702 [Mycena leptocephala]